MIGRRTNRGLREGFFRLALAYTHREEIAQREVDEASGFFLSSKGRRMMSLADYYTGRMGK